MTCYEYRVIDTGKHVERELNALGAEGWKVVGVTTKKQLLIAPPQAIILMREVRLATAASDPLDDLKASAREPILVSSHSA